jgi:hypothetical protein
MTDSGLSDSDFYGSDSSDEDLDDFEVELRAILQSMVAATNAYHLFNANKWDDNGQQSVNPLRGVRDMLGWLKETPCMFKTLTNFTLVEFEELCTLVCPTIAGNARSTSAPQRLQGRLPKLNPKQRLLNFIWFMKCNSVTSYDSFH